MVQNDSLSVFHWAAKTVLKITIVLIFAIQTSFNARLYLKRGMYFLVTNDFNSAIQLPDITICPSQPWDPRKLEKYGVDNAETSHFSQILATINKFWLQHTGLKAKEVWNHAGWDLGAVVEKFVFGDLQEEYDRSETTSEHWFRSLTPMGPCHTLRLPPTFPDSNRTLSVYPRFGPNVEPCFWEWQGHLDSYQYSEDCSKVLALCNTSCGWEAYLHSMTKRGSYVIALTGDRGLYSAPYPTVYVYRMHKYNRHLSLLAETTETNLDSKGCIDSEVRHRCLINELESESIARLGCIPYVDELVENLTLGEICSVHGDALSILVEKDTTRCPDLCQSNDWKYRNGPYVYQDSFKIDFKVAVPYTLRKNEKELYPLSILLSDTGGSMGFFLGVSIFSLVEWFVSCLQKYWTRKHKLSRKAFSTERDHERNSHRVRIKYISITPVGYGRTEGMEPERHLKKESVLHGNCHDTSEIPRSYEDRTQSSIELFEGRAPALKFHNNEILKYIHILRLIWLLGRVFLGLCVVTHSLVAVYTYYTEPVQHSVSQFSPKISFQDKKREVGYMMVKRLASRSFRCYDVPFHDEDQCLQSCLLFMSIKELPSLSPFFYIDDLPICGNMHIHLPQYRYIAPQYMYEVLLQKYKQRVCQSICSSYSRGYTLISKNDKSGLLPHEDKATYRTWTPPYSSSPLPTQSTNMTPTTKQVPSMRNLTRLFTWKYLNKSRVDIDELPTGTSKRQPLYEQLAFDEVDDTEILPKITKVARLLCEIGGIAGLYMGVSILTLLSTLQEVWKNMGLKLSKGRCSPRSSSPPKILSVVFKATMCLLGAFLVVCKGFSFLLDHPVTTQISEKEERLDGYMPAVTLCHWPPLSLGRLALTLNLPDFTSKEDDFLDQVRNMSLVLNTTVGQISVAEFFEKENAVDVFWTLEEMILIYTLVGNDVKYLFPRDPDPRWTSTMTPFGRCFTFRTNGTEKGLSSFEVAPQYHAPITQSYMTVHSPTEEPLLMGLSDSLESYPLIKMEKYIGVEAKALSPAEYTSFEGRAQLKVVTSCPVLFGNVGDKHMLVDSFNT